MSKKVNVLFVCMGNICRSPTADPIFKYQVKKAGLDLDINVDSAGTHSYHIGHSPDNRAQEAALKRGYDMQDLRARAVVPEDFSRFDYILAMDHDNLAILKDRCPPQHQHKLALLMQYSHNHTADDEVSDPYYGGKKGFENVLDKVEAANEGLLQHIRKSDL